MNEPERSRVAAARAVLALHEPIVEVAEIWVDGPGEDIHRERWPDCTDCEGHEISVEVCSECGYEHDGDRALFRSWPCPTVLALSDCVASLPVEESTT